MTAGRYVEDAFPLVARELLMLGRRGNTYFARVGVVLSPLVFILPYWVVELFGDTGIVLQAELAGRALMTAVLAFQLIAVIAVAPSSATSLMAMEKEENALSLLIMADRSGWDIVFAKFLACYLHVLLLIVALLPLQVMAIILGSGGLGVAVVRTLLLSAFAAAVVAIGLYCAIRCQRSATAGGLCTFLLVLWLGPLTYRDMLIMRGGGGDFFYSPLTAFVFMTAPIVAQGAWFVALVSCLAVFVAAMVASHSALMKVVRQDGAARPTSEAILRREGFVVRRNREPIAALIQGACMRGTLANHPLVWLLRFAATFVACLAPFLGWLMVLVLMMRGVVQSLITMRDNQAWAELSLIPVTEKELGVSTARCFRRDTIYVCVAVVPAMLFYWIGGGGEFPGWLLILGITYFLLLYNAALYGALAAGLQPKNQRQCEYGASYRIIGILIFGWLVGGLMPQSVVEFIQYTQWNSGYRSSEWTSRLQEILVILAVVWNFVLVIAMWQWDKRLVLRRLRRAYR